MNSQDAKKTAEQLRADAVDATLDLFRDEIASDSTMPPEIDIEQLRYVVEEVDRLRKKVAEDNPTSLPASKMASEYGRRAREAVGYNENILEALSAQVEWLSKIVVSSGLVDAQFAGAPKGANEYGIWPIVRSPLKRDEFVIEEQRLAFEQDARDLKKTEEELDKKEG